MKIKIDKDEWENLLERVADLEASDRSSLQRYGHLIDHLQEMMENFFRYKVQTYMIKRDKDMIVAELRKEVMDNIFKEADE